MKTPVLPEADPFELPEWLGQGPVTWAADYGIREGHLIHGALHDEEGHTLACDLLAVDQAYPRPVADEPSRARAHQSWRHGQVLLVEHDQRLTLAVPGAGFDAEQILDALARLAKSVGARQDDFSAVLRLGRARRQ